MIIRPIFVPPAIYCLSKSILQGELWVVLAFLAGSCLFTALSFQAEERGDSRFSGFIDDALQANRTKSSKKRG